MGLSRRGWRVEFTGVNKWVDLRRRAAVRPDEPVPPWTDPDRAVLDHMREILGGSLFDGCGQPDCFDCAEDRPSR